MQFNRLGGKSTFPLNAKVKCKTLPESFNYKESSDSPKSFPLCNLLKDRDDCSNTVL